MVFSNNLLMGAGGQAAGYKINQSIRFNDDDAAYLYRDVDSDPTNGKKFTYSVWIKRGAITGGTNTGLLSGGSGTSTGRCDFVFTAGSATGDGSNNDALKFDIYSGSFDQTRSTAKLRDPSSWYHIVLVFDAENGTANNTLIIYLNGNRLELDSTSGVPDVAALVNANGQRTRVGADASGTPVEFDGYMAEINMVDGQALAPTNFGETNSDTDQWVPIKYSGSYGTNGFYIKGEDSSNLGNDSSGNDNDFTSTGLAAADQVTDSPTNNTATWNSVSGTVNPATLSDGNLTAVKSGSGTGIERSTISFPATENFYAEFTIDATGSGSYVWQVGVIRDDDPGLHQTSESRVGDEEFGYAYSTNWSSTPVPNKSNNGTKTSYGTAGSAGHVIGVQLNNGSLTFYHNNSSQGVAFTGLSGNFLFAFSGQGGAKVTANFGQTGFTYTPPTGAKALTAPNLPDPTIALPGDHMNTVLYIGNGTTGQSITGVGFQPDWVWTKIRSPNAYSHQLFDAVRGAGKNLQSNNTNAEGDLTSEFISFDSDGFTIDDVNQNVNESGSYYASWNWKANGSGSSNTAGSINTTATSANTTAGFSISTFTGNGTSGATFGHGLGVAPKMVIVKERSPGGNNWMVGHDAMGWGKYIALDTNAAQVTSSARWNDTAPSSTVVTLGNDTGINQNTATYVAYCFAEVEGYSSIGGYKGNGSTDGSFIYTGFKPAWIMLKRYDSSGEWEVSDRVRDPDNPVRLILQPNSNAVEWDATTRDIDWLSNGFKHRSSHADFNASGGDYLYLAFAESPFKTATAR